MFFRFLLHRFCVFLHDFCIFSHFFVKFSAWANANWQISGVICCVFDDHPMQISQNFPTCTVEITQHALLYGWNYPARPERAEAPSPGQRPGFLLCVRVARPVRAKALHIAEDFPIFIRCILKLLPLQGALLIALYPGRCPGLRASALSGRAAVGFLVFWAFCCGLLGLQGVLLWASAPFTFALPFGQRFSIPLRAGDRWFRACFCELLGLRPYLKPATFKRIIQKKERKWWQFEKIIVNLQL